MRTFTLYILLWAWAVAAQADPISSAKAREIAQAFFEKRGVKSNFLPTRVAGESRWSTQAPYYIFNSTQQRGFVVISGEDNFPSVLGYTLQGQYDEASAPVALQALLDEYALRIGQLADRGVNRSRKGNFKAIGPLFKTAWHQEEPFNLSCPIWQYADGSFSSKPCVVGCVATSIAQVLNYYKYPEVLQDTLFGWRTDHYTIDPIEKGTPIDWANIRDSYKGDYSALEAKAVADLSYYCGVSCRMNWGVTVSGASMGRITPNLQRAFGYGYARLYDRMHYSPSNWSALLHRELAAGRPIIYAGANVERSSHAFNIDGCDEQGLFHIDWGYREDFNGYFDIDVLNPFEEASDQTPEGVLTGHFCNHVAVFLHPDPQTLPPIDSLTIGAQDVRVDSVRFAREPDTNKYLRVDLYLTNLHPDTLTYPMGLFLAHPTDSIILSAVTWVGITGGTLAPKCQTVVSAYCHFTRPGEYRFGYTYDDLHIPYAESITVADSPTPQLSFGAVSQEWLTPDRFGFSLAIENDQAGGWAGNLVTYSLFEEGVEEDVRHWTFLNLAPGEELTDQKEFAALKPNRRYTLKVRCPWNVVAEYSFTTPQATLVEGLHQEKKENFDLYTPSGQWVGRFSKEELPRLQERVVRGIYLIEGKKIYINR